MYMLDIQRTFRRAMWISMYIYIYVYVLCIYARHSEDFSQSYVNLYAADSSREANARFETVALTKTIHEKLKLYEKESQGQTK